MGIYRPDLQANTEAVHYDFNSRTGVLHLDAASCTSMDGCIALFKMIDPNVECIFTTSGEFHDARYYKNSEDEWAAGKPAGGYHKEKWSLPHSNFRG